MSNINQFARTSLPPDTIEAQQGRNLNTAFSEPNAVNHAAVEVGARKGETVTQMAGQSAAGLLDTDNLEEAGALLTGHVKGLGDKLGERKRNIERRAVTGKGGAGESGDTGSATADTDEPGDQVRRLLAFRDFTGGRDGRGGGGGAGQQQQQRQYARLQAQTGEKIRKASGDLLKSLSAIRNTLGGRARTGAVGEQAQQREVRNRIWDALRTYDADAVQQLAALEIVSSQFTGDDPADSALLAALNAVRSEFDEATVGRAVRETMSAIGRLTVAEATHESSPSLFREQQRQLMRESRNFSDIFEALKNFDPTRKLGDIVSDFMAGAGSNLADGTGPALDDDFRHHLLTEIAVLKKLNSVFDHTAQKVVTPMSRLLGRGQIDTVAVTRAILGFVSDDNVDRSAARQLETVLPGQAAPSDRVMYSTCVLELHRELPDDLFPEGEINGDAVHRNAQGAVLLSWCEELAAEEEEDEERRGGGGQDAESGGDRQDEEDRAEGGNGIMKPARAHR
ncbi:MAG: hypothetical protein ACOYJQ_00370 [Pseudochelatococcus sp.]|jgi:hypothetical protein|uniref:hypothetical protein n=1 Tax=Pseudochelatococcus sp. TaxID=2020869 RepID=UPI003D8FCD80